ncbi:MAG TPA: hypothetical protein VFR37_03350 [Longimicrobium sp.]|nr:hypothetical protein [Longimicrobium sp.]
MRVHSVAALGLCLLASACVTTWEPQYGPVPQTAAAHQGRTVRLVLVGGQTSVDLQNMRVEGDSIVGESGNPPQRLAFATTDVQVVMVSRRDESSAANAIITSVGQVAIAMIIGLALIVATAIASL